MLAKYVVEDFLKNSEAQRRAYGQRNQEDAHIQHSLDELRYCDGEEQHKLRDLVPGVYGK